MDMHGFARPLPPQSAFSQAHAPSTTPAHHSPQHAPSPFQNPPARGQQQPFFQPTQQRAFPQGGGVPGSGALMQPPTASQMQLHTRAQQQQQQQQPSSPYTNAPFSPALPSPAASAAQKYAHLSKPSAASPSNGTSHVSPYASAPNSHSNPTPSPLHPPQQSPAHQQQLPMAAPQPVKSVPPSPVSPVAQARDKERVTLLLEINTELLQEICALQVQGKSGHIGPMPPPKEEGKEDVKAASKEYIDCMRRLQANLSYLATTAERAHKPAQQVPPGPAIMSVPPTPPSLSELYTKLQSLFPGWKGQQQPMKASPGPQQPGRQQQQGMQQH